MKQTSYQKRREKIRKNYDRISSVYDILGGYLEKKYRERTLLSIGLEKGEKVLEVGFGTGDMLIEIYRSVGEGGEVYGVDISSGMIEEARKKLQRTGSSNKISIIAGDAVRLPFVGAYFDAVLMTFTLESFSDEYIKEALSEIHRVLVDQGRVGILSLSSRGSSLVRGLYEFAHDRFPTLIDCRPIPLAELLGDNRFRVEKREVDTIFGLPIEIAVGRK